VVAADAAPVSAVAQPRPIEPDVAMLADRVYDMINDRLARERERRGLH
jgi:hypothetical protein